MNGQPNSTYAARLSSALSPIRTKLTNHPVYEQLHTVEALRSFMEAHVFAVWDFMSLVKALQQRITCVSVPWQPPADPASARIINEIVLAEESDVTPDGRTGSHFELYLTAMAEVGADTRPIQRTLRGLQAGQTPAAALASSEAHPHTRAFVLNTMFALAGDTHEIAACFLLGRETLIPHMFERVLATTRGRHAPTLRWYLQRHIQVDGDDHGPAGWRLLERLCAGDARRWREAAASAKRALRARAALWDGVCETIARGDGPQPLQPSAARAAAPSLLEP